MTWAAVAGLILCAIIFTVMGVMLGYSAHKIIRMEVELHRYRQLELKEKAKQNPRMN